MKCQLPLDFGPRPSRPVTSTETPNPVPEPVITPETPPPSVSMLASGALESPPAFDSYRLGLMPEEPHHADAEGAQC